MQEYTSDPAWPSMNGAEAAAYNPHVSNAVTDLQTFYAHDQPVAGHTFDSGLDEYQATYAEPPQQVFGPAQPIASPYPDPPSASMDNRYSAPPGWEPLSSDDSGGGGDFGYDGKLNTSYAHLIYMCLLEAPNHSRKLKEIYDWIRIRTNKADDLTTNGWQNSVRHNLSMNKVRSLWPGSPHLPADKCRPSSSPAKPKVGRSSVIGVSTHPPSPTAA